VVCPHMAFAGGGGSGHLAVGNRLKIGLYCANGQTKYNTSSPP